LGVAATPSEITVRTPTGPFTLTTYGHDPILTTNQIFCPHDYPTKAQDRIIVDFGSNIGVSTAYFLTSSPKFFVTFMDCFYQISIPRDNLRSFEGRHALHEIAVAAVDGGVEFGWEDTGRYDGVRLKPGNHVSVPCRDSNKILKEIVMRHSRIDILKADIETLERQVTERIPAALHREIDRIYVECAFEVSR
jgi:FkbM family methyltransferase